MPRHLIIVLVNDLAGGLRVRGKQARKRYRALFFVSRVVSRLGFRDHQQRHMFKPSPEICMGIARPLVLCFGVMRVLVATVWRRTWARSGAGVGAPKAVVFWARGVRGVRRRRGQAARDVGPRVVTIAAESIVVILQPNELRDRQQYRWRERFPLALSAMCNAFRDPHSPWS